MHPVTETLTRETAAALLSLLTVAETPARAVILEARAAR